MTEGVSSYISLFADDEKQMKNRIHKAKNGETRNNSCKNQNWTKITKK